MEIQRFNGAQTQERTSEAVDASIRNVMLSCPGYKDLDTNALLTARDICMRVISLNDSELKSTATYLDNNPHPNDFFEPDGWPEWNQSIIDSYERDKKNTLYTFKRLSLKGSHSMPSPEEVEEDAVFQVLRPSVGVKLLAHSLEYEQIANPTVFRTAAGFITTLLQEAYRTLHPLKT
jgi:hypothetical protein